VIATQEISKGAKLAGRYRVLRSLGTGGMATVFLAEDERLGRQVAIKRLHTDAPKASLRRFRREARIGAALNHPNFVAVYDTLVIDEGALIVMECVQGSSLADLAGGRRMKPKRALPILRSVADALDHAHAEGVVHRDVKPANILVGETGTVKLADLGIARAIGATQITSEGSVVGTLPYMSPERLAGPGAGGPESDVYALAAVAYELLAGRPPSEAASTEEATSRPPPDLLADWPGAPPAVAAVLERGLDPEPGGRQGSAGSLVDELETALLGGPEAETLLAPTERDTRPTLVQPRPQGRGVGRGLSRGAAIGLIGLGIAAVAAIAIGGGGDGGSSDLGGDSPPAVAEEAKEKPAKEEKAPPEESAAASAAELNDLGFALINEGRYDEAIPVLERAVAAFPDGSTDLTYAFALFNLGHALRLAGRPEEAIPILEQRLQIPNQTGEVRRELEAAIAAAGGGDEEEDNSGPGNGNGEAKGHDKD